MSQIACISAALLLSALGLVAAQQGPAPASAGPELCPDPETCPPTADCPAPLVFEPPLGTTCGGCACQ